MPAGALSHRLLLAALRNGCPPDTAFPLYIAESHQCSIAPNALQSPSRHIGANKVPVFSAAAARHPGVVGSRAVAMRFGFAFDQTDCAVRALPNKYRQYSAR